MGIAGCWQLHQLQHAVLHCRSGAGACSRAAHACPQPTICTACDTPSEQAVSSELGVGVSRHDEQPAQQGAASELAAAPALNLNRKLEKKKPLRIP